MEVERSGGRIANAIIIPMIVVVVLAVAGVFGLLLWSASVSNETARESKEQLLSGALQLLLNDGSGRLDETVVSNQTFLHTSGFVQNQGWLTENIGERLYKHGGFQRSLILDRNLLPMMEYSGIDGKPFLTQDLREQIMGSVAKVRAKGIMAAMSDPKDLSAAQQSRSGNADPLLNASTGYAKMDDGIYVFTAAAIRPGQGTIRLPKAPPVVLVSFKKLDNRLLRLLSNVTDINRLKLVQTAPKDADTASVTLRTFTGVNIAHLVWVTEQPGTALLNRLSPVLLILLLAIIGLTIGVIDFTRQTTKRLAISQARAVYNSRHDTLSGLPNREKFFLLLKAALQGQDIEKGGTAVVYIDLDRFKDINDTLGHAAGDTVIRVVADRLSAVLPRQAVLARISGDEFAMFIPDVSRLEQVQTGLSRMQDALLRPVSAEGTEIFVSLSMGAAMSPRDGTDPGELMRKADIALYDAKASGRGRWSFFDPSMQEEVLTKDKLSRELRKAIDNDHLSIAYQPQSDRAGKQIVALEALARWEHPEMGKISPVDFIPMAEETGLINDLGLWILRRTCQDAKVWTQMQFAVNVSPTQFKHPRFVEQVLEILQEAEIPPHRLEIEVTENVFLGDQKAILDAMRRLQDLGVKVALDDFGSGYSSLSYLRKFPFDSLKIDRDFLSAVENSQEARAIVSTIVTLGKALGMEVVAEGIESRGQLEFLAETGCDRIQGYFISAPLSSRNLAEFLDDHHLETSMQPNRLTGFSKHENTDTSGRMTA